MARPKCIEDYENAVFSYYRFEPSVAGNVVFVVLFALSTLIHGFQMWRTRTWYLTALILGGLAEMIGYIGRVMGALEDPGCWTMGPFIMQAVLILIAPALMAASIYMILGRIILLTDGEHHALIKQRWLTKIFVTGDVLSFLMQSCGGGLMASADTIKLGEKVIIGGLFVQLVFFSCFIAVAGVLHYRMVRNPTSRANRPEVRWQQYLVTLYLTGALILVRSVFRVVEFIEGNKGPLMRKEVYVFVFDGLLMTLLVFWMNWFHPSEIGLLLRGDEPIKNGMELFKVSRGGRQRVESNSEEGLHSTAPAMEATPPQTEHKGH